LYKALIEVMAIVAEVVKVEAVKADEVEEVAIKAGANIKVKDVAVEVKKEKVTITLIISYYY
jgi:hypothetical protein